MWTWTGFPLSDPAPIFLSQFRISHFGVALARTVIAPGNLDFIFIVFKISPYGTLETHSQFGSIILVWPILFLDG